MYTFDFVSRAASAAITSGFTWEAFGKAFCVVGVAELFDKTWFITLLMALKYGRRLAFAGSAVALAIHTVISAFLGIALAKYIIPSTLDFATAALFAILAIMYAKDCYCAEEGSDMIAAGREEAEEAQAADEESNLANAGSKEQTYDYGLVKSLARGEGAKGVRSRFHVTWEKFMEVCLAVFIAEWGDRTQIAMVGLHSSLPIIPVFVGSLLAFAVLSLSAVLVAAAVEEYKITERMVFGLVSISFVVFAMLSLNDGLKELALSRSLSSNTIPQ